MCREAYLRQITETFVRSGQRDVRLCGHIDLVCSMTESEFQSFHARMQDRIGLSVTGGAR